MSKKNFLCEGSAGNIIVEIEGENIFIGESGKSGCTIPVKTLQCIEYRNYPWVQQNNETSFVLSFIWKNEGHERTKDIQLFHERNTNMGFVRFLKHRFPDQSMIGPREMERERLCNRSDHNVYRLYSLGLLTGLGIISLIILIQIIFLILSLTTSQFVVVSNTDTFYRAGAILSIATFIPLSLFMMIIAKKLMVVKTNQKGLTVQRIIRRTTFTWDEIEFGNGTTETSNIYTGLFCYYSDKVNVLTSRNFLEIPLRTRTGEIVKIKMSADDAGRFYRELYYRGKISLEEARRMRAFL
jgi:hypothetical protein